MKTSAKQVWNGIERRKAGSRRRAADLLIDQERRCDRRNGAEKKSRSLIGWLRSYLKPRLGVDRRKTVDRRVLAKQYIFNSGSLLTREEIADLLE
ncbi:MAG: hypothetical protein KJ804_14655 [Proteobacteria bacterium]|nr:hypothetical protein [Pseudomonadota bacterium]MBU1059550.1 hypothetical protein [Pseudomonadota bacterium]